MIQFLSTVFASLYRFTSIEYVYEHVRANRTCYIGPYVVYFAMTGSLFVSLLFIQSFFFLFCILYFGLRFFLFLCFSCLSHVLSFSHSYVRSFVSYSWVKTSYTHMLHGSSYVKRKYTTAYAQFVFRMLVITDNTENADNTTDLLYNKCCAV